MLSEIINNQDLRKYLVTFSPGEYLFIEGDDSQDLYFLISGHVEIFKGDKKLEEITEAGSLFGEISFLLGGKRTLSARAETDLEVLCIPKKEVPTFLRKFPSVMEKVTRLLALRLEARSHAFYGLKELCDKLPDAVIMTDREGKILTWNAAAERLYGRDWHHMQNSSAQDIYEEPEAYHGLVAEVRSEQAVREKILRVRHPQKGVRFISTSTTTLHDGHHNFQGLLSLGRDVTETLRLEHRYRRVRSWLIPSLIMVALLAGAIFWGYPRFSKTGRTMDLIKQDLRNQLAKDHLLLGSLLLEPYLARDRRATTRIMKEFFDIQEKDRTPYTGVALLDGSKRVFDAYSFKEGTGAGAVVGSSYGNIEFQSSDNADFRVLTLYRPDKDHPMGAEGIEIAFEMKKEGQSLGWLIFQMDAERLKEVYNIDSEGLKKFRF